MQPYTNYLPVLIGFCLTLSLKSYAQDTAERIIYPVLREQEPLYRGGEYWRFPYHIINGIAYFQADTITSGNVRYYGRNYNNVPLIYDQTTDELVTVDLSRQVMIRLFSPMIDSFELHGAKFIYLQDSASAERQGFWQILVDEKNQLMKREIKVIKTKVVDHDIARVLQLLTFYHLIHDGAVHDVSNKKDMLEAFNSQRGKITAFLKKNRKRFRKAGFETMLTETTRYYNQISAR